MKTNLATKTPELETPERPMSRSFFEPATPGQELSGLTSELHEFAPLIGYVSMQLTSEVEGVSYCGISAGVDDDKAKIWQVQVRNGSSAGLLHGRVEPDSTDWRYLKVDSQGRAIELGSVEDPDGLLAEFVVNALYSVDATKVGDALLHQKIESITECHKIRKSAGSHNGWLTRQIDVLSAKRHAHNARIGFLTNPKQQFVCAAQTQRSVGAVDELPGYVRNILSYPDPAFSLRTLK